jgi:hypothetical protein
MEQGKPMHCQHNFLANWVDIPIVSLLLQLYCKKMINQNYIHE